MLFWDETTFLDKNYQRRGPSKTPEIPNLEDIQPFIKSQLVSYRLTIFSCLIYFVVYTADSNLYISLLGNSEA